MDKYIQGCVAKSDLDVLEKAVAYGMIIVYNNDAIIVFCFSCLPRLHIDNVKSVAGSRFPASLLFACHALVLSCSVALKKHLVLPGTSFTFITFYTEIMEMPQNIAEILQSK